MHKQVYSLKLFIYFNLSALNKYQSEKIYLTAFLDWPLVQRQSTRVKEKWSLRCCRPDRGETSLCEVAGWTQRRVRRRAAGTRCVHSRRAYCTAACAGPMARRSRRARKPQGRCAANASGWTRSNSATISAFKGRERAAATPLASRAPVARDGTRANLWESALALSKACRLIT